MENKETIEMKYSTRHDSHQISIRGQCIVKSVPAARATLRAVASRGKRSRRCPGRKVKGAIMGPRPAHDTAGLAALCTVSVLRDSMQGMRDDGSAKRTTQKNTPQASQLAGY
ncbi:hypothetical protein [Janthinobacterium sp.]|uniref:hypothetical protein n=1 Tax=Janthinobacterium sp. TaxID=1871054 RepID=UPI002590B2CE|nr:hypothetical protein [Janthinobacterium sp.]MCX7291837.1 hypothetical protein [Janthinobacterium sp.]